MLVFKILFFFDRMILYELFFFIVRMSFIMKEEVWCIMGFIEVLKVLCCCLKFGKFFF